MRRATPSETNYIKNLLSKNELPHADISEKWECFYLIESGSVRVGVGGFEQYGDVALLRSIVIEDEHRGTGYGTSLCQQLLSKAQSQGISTVFLLTTTATEFFRRLGFKRVDRQTAPESIQQTSEFRDFCPSTAICMKFELGQKETGATSPV